MIITIKIIVRSIIVIVIIIIIIIMLMIIMESRFYLQENRPRVIATNTHYFYIGILFALWYIIK